MLIINKINNYKEINKNLLDLIDKISINSLKEDFSSICNTDWNLPKNLKREYLEYFFVILKPYLQKICYQLNCRKIEINNAWFQQYTKNDLHQWHTHPKTNFTNIYFVELPNKSLATEILGQKNLELNEGDLLTFPAFYYHRSPVNLSGKRKTIISFNTDVCDYIDYTLFS
jgi:hypothetical protein